MRTMVIVTWLLAGAALAAPRSIEDARGGTGDGVAEVDRLVDVGLAAVKAGDLPGAYAAYLAAAEADRRDPDLWRQAGDLALRLDDLPAADAAWRTALALAPGRFPLLSRAAHGAARIGDFAAAADFNGQIVALADRLPVAQGRALRHRHLVAQAELAALAGDFTTGETAARRALKGARGGAEAIAARLALAYVYLLGEEHELAEGAYLDVLRLDPQNVVALNNLGNLDYLRRDFEGARARFEAILEQPQAEADSVSVAYANLAELSVLSGHYDDARWLYGAARAAYPKGAWSYLGLGALADLEGHYEAAIELTIDGWERDQSRLTRLNTVFVAPEWAWQREALIAEVEGEWARAAKLWGWIADGALKVLVPTAEDHLTALRAVE